METVNIINNFDQKIMAQNILITNQYKLTLECKKIFEQGDLSKENLSIKEAKEYLNEQKFINWNLFIDLINLDFKFYKPNTYKKLNTLEYLIETKSHNLINFLLNVNLNNNNDTEPNLINLNTYNIFLLIFKNFYSYDEIINKTIKLIIKNGWETIFFDNDEQTNDTILFSIVSKCSETVIIKMFESNFIQINWKDQYSNNLIHWACKRNMIELFNWVMEKYPDSKLFNKQNKGGRTPIHLACIKNNLSLTKLLEEKNIDVCQDINSKSHIDYAIMRGDRDLVLYLLNQYAQTDFTPEQFYEIIKYQDEKVVEYFLNYKLANVRYTNLLWTLCLCGYKKFYSQMYSYGKQKMLTLLIDFLTTPPKYYNGVCIDNIFDDYDHDDVGQ